MMPATLNCVSGVKDWQTESCARSNTTMAEKIGFFDRIFSCRKRFPKFPRADCRKSTQWLALHVHASVTRSNAFHDLNRRAHSGAPLAKSHWICRCSWCSFSLYIACFCVSSHFCCFAPTQAAQCTHQPTLSLHECIPECE